MSRYIDAILPPKTLTELEQIRLLEATGTHKEGFRDHVLFAFALGTGLREHEICALTVGDISKDGLGTVARFPLRVFKRSGGKSKRSKAQKRQECILPDVLRFKLEKFLRWKRSEGEGIGPDDPLFAGRQEPHGSLSCRTLRHLFAVWQERAGFERKLTFHALRHTALTNLYRSTKDIRLVQRVARHASVLSTTIYAQASDEDVFQAVRGMRC